MTQPYRPHSVVHPTPEEIAGWVQGRLLRAGGAPERLTGMGTLETALPAEMAFLTDKKRAKGVDACRAGLLIAPEGLDLGERARVEVKQVWPAVVTIMERLYAPPTPAPGVHPTAVIGVGAQLGEGVSIGPYTVVGEGSRLGRGVVLGPHVSIDAGCVVGEGSLLYAKVALQGRVNVGRNVILHSGVVLGADGFRYEPGGPQGLLKIPQVGTVILEDHVEVGANSTIDRAFLHETRIGFGTKIDNQVQIGHNCTIGKFCIICGCVGIAGSVTLGDGVILGGGVGIRDGLTIHSGAQVAGGSQLGEDVPAGAQVMGYAAFAVRDYVKSLSYFRRLPELARRLAAVERRNKDASSR